MSVDLESAIERYGAELINKDSFCGISKGTGVYANEEFIVSDGLFSSLEESSISSLES